MKKSTSSTKSEFVPSLQVLSTEALVNHEKFEEHNLKRMGLLGKYVKENMNLFSYRLDETEHVVDKWHLSKLELPLYNNFSLTDPVVEEIKRNYRLGGDQFQINVHQQLCKDRSITHPFVGWLVKLGGFIGWSIPGDGGYVAHPDCPDCGIKMDLPFLQMKKTKLFITPEGGPDVAVQVRLCPKCRKPKMTLNRASDIFDLNRSVP